MDRLTSGVDHTEHEVNANRMTGVIDDCRALAIMLLHLASQAGAGQLAPWAGALRAEARQRRTTSRGVRWGIRPPTSPEIRSHALTVADGILTAPDVDAATVVLLPWLELTPHTPEGVLGWLADHTVMTTTLTRVVFAARAPHRRLSHHLDTRPPLPNLSAENIPQVSLLDATCTDHARWWTQWESDHRAATSPQTRDDAARPAFALCGRCDALDVCATWAEIDTYTGLAAGAAYRKGSRVDHTLRYGRPERRGGRTILISEQRGPQ